MRDKGEKPLRYHSRCLCFPQTPRWVTITETNPAKPTGAQGHPLGLQLPGDIPQGPPCRSSTQVSGSLVGDSWVLVLFHAFNLYILSSWRGFVNCFCDQKFQLRRGFLPALVLGGGSLFSYSQFRLVSLAGTLRWGDFLKWAESHQRPTKGPAPVEPREEVTSTGCGSTVGPGVGGVT